MAMADAPQDHRQYEPVDVATQAPLYLETAGIERAIRLAGGQPPLVVADQPVVSPVSKPSRNSGV